MRTRGPPALDAAQGLPVETRKKPGTVLGYQAAALVWRAGCPAMLHAQRHACPADPTNPLLAHPGTGPPGQVQRMGHPRLGKRPLGQLFDEHDVPVGGRDLQAQGPAHAGECRRGDLLGCRLQQGRARLVHDALAVLVRLKLCQVPAQGRTPATEALAAALGAAWGARQHTMAAPASAADHMPLPPCSAQQRPTGQADTWRAAMITFYTPRCRLLWSASVPAVPTARHPPAGGVQAGARAACL